MKHLIIIGGGFAGAYIAKELEQEFNVTLFDTKDYFEFTPSILRTLVEPEHAKKIEVRHKTYLQKATIIQEAVTAIDQKKVITKKNEYSFDYLVIASGSRYNAPIKAQNIVIASRGKELQKYARQLQEAKHVLIVGGGVVGTELAAEIVQHFPHKTITLVHAQAELLERTPAKARRYAEAFLRKRGVELIFRERVTETKHKGKYVTDAEREIPADLVFLCTGIAPNSELMNDKDLNGKKFVKVNEFLQLTADQQIFAAGDVNDVKEEKTAQSAEKQAGVVVENIRALAEGRELQRYVSKPRPMVISLGKWDGIFIHKNFVLNGVVPSLMKQLIEWKTMRKYQR